MVLLAMTSLIPVVSVPPVSVTPYIHKKMHHKLSQNVIRGSPDIRIVIGLLV